MTSETESVLGKAPVLLYPIASVLASSIFLGSPTLQGTFYKYHSSLLNNIIDPELAGWPRKIRRSRLQPVHCSCCAYSHQHPTWDSSAWRSGILSHYSSTWRRCCCGDNTRRMTCCLKGVDSGIQSDIDLCGLYTVHKLWSVQMRLLKTLLGEIRWDRWESGEPS